MEDKVALGQVFSDYFGFLCRFSFHQLLHSHLSSRAGTVGLLGVDVSSALSLTPSHEIKKKIELTRSHHWSLYGARSIQSVPFHTIYRRSILILTSHILLELLSGFHPSEFSYQSSLRLYVFSVPSTCPSPSNTLWYNSKNIRRGVQIMKLLFITSSPASSYSPIANTLLIHPQPILPTSWETKFHTHLEQQTTV
jgi:hypothetical protein